jgi:Fe-S-cluster containining protein
VQFENVVVPDQISFQCKGCGRCCKEQPADVNSEDQARIEAKGFTGFLDENDLTEPRLIRSKKDGTCFFLTANNKCMIEDVKPAICRLVPFVVTDWDYVQNLIEVDLPPDFDCPGVHEGCQVPLKTLAEAAQAYVRDTQNIIANQEKLLPTDPKVLSKTRQLIIKESIEDVST